MKKKKIGVLVVVVGMGFILVGMVQEISWKTVACMLGGATVAAVGALVFLDDSNHKPPKDSGYYHRLNPNARGGK